MDSDSLVRFIQEHFTDGLVLVIGSRVSAAEAMPGTAALLNAKKQRCMLTMATILTRS